MDKKDLTLKNLSLNKNKCEHCDGLEKKEEKLKGKISIYASGGMFHWGTDVDGKIWEQWGNGPWTKKFKEEEEK